MASHRKAMARILRLALVLGLCTTSLVKRWWTDQFIESQTAALYVGAGILELLLAALILIPKTAQFSVAATGAVFGGFLVGTLGSLLAWGEPASCKCLGSGRVPEGWLLVIQGALVLLAGLSAMGSEGRRRDPARIST